MKAESVSPESISDTDLRVVFCVTSFPLIVLDLTRVGRPTSMCCHHHHSFSPRLLSMVSLSHHQLNDNKKSDCHEHECRRYDWWRPLLICGQFAASRMQVSAEQPHIYINQVFAVLAPKTNRQRRGLDDLFCRVRSVVFSFLRCTGVAAGLVHGVLFGVRLLLQTTSVCTFLLFTMFTSKSFSKLTRSTHCLPQSSYPK